MFEVGEGMRTYSGIIDGKIVTITTATGKDGQQLRSINGIEEEAYYRMNPPTPAIIADQVESKPLVYRNEYPTEPGWYWQICRISTDGPWFEKIRLIESGVNYEQAGEVWFAGPITPPERPK